MSRLHKLFSIALITVGALPGIVSAQFHPAGRVKTNTSIQVEMIKAKVTVPAEFQVAVYESLIQEIEAKGGFGLIYRDGDRDAQSNSSLMIMRTTITEFEEGSERARQVTTVKGATKMIVHCQFTSSDGAVLLQRDIEGKVRLFGDNLKVTQDVAKKAAQAADDALSLYRKNQLRQRGA